MRLSQIWVEPQDELLDSTGKRKPDDLALPVREVARLLGIGRTRVIQLEQAAIKKMRRVLTHEAGCSFEAISSRIYDIDILDKSIKSKFCIEDKSNLFPPEKGWITVERIQSINAGSVNPEDIARTFHFLHESHESIVKTPTYIRRGGGLYLQYYIRGVVSYDNKLLVRCTRAVKRSCNILEIKNHRCTVIVESEWGIDDKGKFDIPIMLFAFLVPL